MLPPSPPLPLSSIRVAATLDSIRALGSGSFGDVWLVRCTRTQAILVRKSARHHGSDSERRQAVREAEVLRLLRHPNIVRFVDQRTSDDGKRLEIIMDFCDSGDLGRVIRRAKRKRVSLPETRVVSWYVQVVLALDYLHGLKHLHRDIKPANIFLCQKERLVKLGDFGLSKVLEHTSAVACTHAGTPLYNFSPEMCRNRPYSYGGDIWALGVVVYELLALEVPFQGRDIVQLGNQVLQEDPAPLSRNYSKSLRRVVGQMLAKNAEDRPSAQDLIQTRLLQRGMKALVGTYGEDAFEAAMDHASRPPAAAVSAAGGGAGAAGGAGAVVGAGGAGDAGDAGARAKGDQRVGGVAGGDSGGTNERHPPPHAAVGGAVAQLGETKGGEQEKGGSEEAGRVRVEAGETGVLAVAGGAVDDDLESCGTCADDISDGVWLCRVQGVGFGVLVLFGEVALLSRSGERTFRLESMLSSRCQRCSMRKEACGGLRHISIPLTHNPFNLPFPLHFMFSIPCIPL